MRKSSTLSHSILFNSTPALRTTPSDSDERLAEPERAKAWTALSHFHGGSLHTNVSVEL